MLYIGTTTIDILAFIDLLCEAEKDMSCSVGCVREPLPHSQATTCCLAQAANVKRVYLGLALLCSVDGIM